MPTVHEVRHAHREQYADLLWAARGGGRGIVTPLRDATGTASYLDVQSSADDAFPDGNRSFMRALGLGDLDDAAIDTLLAWDARRPSRSSRCGRWAVPSRGSDPTRAPSRSVANAST